MEPVQLFWGLVMFVIALVFYWAQLQLFKIANELQRIRAELEKLNAESEAAPRRKLFTRSKSFS